MPTNEELQEIAARITDWRSSKGARIELKPSPNYLTRHHHALDAYCVPIREGDTVYDKDTGDRFEVDGFSYDCVVCTDVDTGESDIEIVPSQLTHTKTKIDSWERIEEDARGLDSGVDRELFTHTHEDIVRRCRALAERGERREMIVRCRGCSYASSAGLDCDPEAMYCVVMDAVVAPDGFCSFGERRGA